MPRIVFIGSPEFAVPALRALAERYDVAGVVTQPDRPAGRGRQLQPPAVKVAAAELGLPVMQPVKLRLPEPMEQLRQWSPELIVVAAFGQILRPEVLSMPPHGCVNVHASLLPRWRGAAPIQAALLAGDSQTGVTIMQMDPGVDTGAILSQRGIPIAPDETAGSLSEKLSALGTDLLLDTLPGYLAGKIHPRLQDEQGATYAPMLTKQDALLDTARPADDLARRVRAFNPRPGAYLVWEGDNLKVHMAHAEEGESTPGRRLAQNGRPAIGTGQGILVLDLVQPAGRKPMDGRAFLAGARDWIS
ncbi:MAG TPA: methionyl-tRNA formyltransferase [Anaerolineales bacterium]